MGVVRLLFKIVLLLMAYDGAAGKKTPTQLISNVKNQLTGFTGPLVTRVKTQLTELNSKLENLSQDEKKNISSFLAVVSDNIKKFGDARNDSDGAIQAAARIVGAISELFGQSGQLSSIGSGFISALLGLFDGKGSKPKGRDDFVDDQSHADEIPKIESDFVRAYYRVNKLFELMSVKGQTSKSNIMFNIYRLLTSLAMSNPLSVLTKRIEKRFRENQAHYAHDSIKLCDEYTKYAAIKVICFTRLMLLTPRKTQPFLDMKTHLDGLLEEGKKVLGSFYNTDLSSKILPYFDPDNNKVIDTYATSILKLEKYDRSLAGMYCLKISGKDFVWSTQNSYLLSEGKPYTKVVQPNDANCYWKLVPHGKNLFSIVNKKGCETEDARCDWMLSWTMDYNYDQAFVNIDPSDPVLWEIKGGDWFRIRSKWGCDTGSKYCNDDLKVRERKVRRGFFVSYVKAKGVVGELIPSIYNKNHWQLIKKVMI